MPSVDVPTEIHSEVEEYADNHGLSVRGAYLELIEYALHELESGDDDDLRSGIA